MRIVTYENFRNGLPENVSLASNWKPTCDECGRIRDAIVSSGDVYSDNGARWICRECLRDALAMIESEGAK